MIDIQYIRENPEVVTEKSAQKGYPVDVPRLLELDVRRRELVTQAEMLRAQRNELSAAMKGGKPTPEQIEQGKALKDQLSGLETELEPIEDEYEKLLRAVPNMPVEGVPIGVSEEENQVTKTVGEPTKFDGFTPKNHWEIVEPRGMLDKVRAAKIAGSRFGYLKGGLVRLEFAIVNYVMQTLGDEAVIKKIIQDNDIRGENGELLNSKPFMPILPPALQRTEPYVASARLNASDITYKIEQDDLWLNASAEHTLCTMYWNEILPEEVLPIRYIGFLTSFRREAGTYGKDTEGMLRWHQFDKLEMEIFSTPETGLAEHKLAVAIQEYLVQSLRVPYRYLEKCTADIGKPNAKGVDLECWFPGQNVYRETHTADYMTDYQARDLKTRIRRSGGHTDGGRIDLAHTNDATAFATNRIIAAIIENFQTADGRIIVPEVLRPYMGGVQEI
jgi:seryl-tRNA synthetase